MNAADRAIARAKRDNADAIAQAERDYLRAMQAIVPPITPPAPPVISADAGTSAALPAPAGPSPSIGAGGALYIEGESV